MDNANNAKKEDDHINEDILKNEDDPRNENHLKKRQPKKEDNLKNKDNPKKTTLKMKTSLWLWCFTRYFMP